MLNRTLLRAGAALALLVSGWLGSAQAGVVYQGRWDPAYGADFPTMGWRAEAQLVVDDACVTSLGSFTGTLNALALTGFAGCAADGNGDGGIRLSNLLLGLYALPGGPSTDLYGSDDWIVASDGNCGFACFLSIDFDGGDIVGFQTETNDLVQANTGVGYLSRPDFLNTCAQQPQQIDSRNVSWNLALGVGGSASSQLSGGYFGECGDTASQNQPVEITLIKVGTVPEPASLALVGVALLGVAASRRRSLARRG